MWAGVIADEREHAELKIEEHGLRLHELERQDASEREIAARCALRESSAHPEVRVQEGATPTAEEVRVEVDAEEAEMRVVALRRPIGERSAATSSSTTSARPTAPWNSKG
jgi:hypothetical protein